MSKCSNGNFVLGILIGAAAGAAAAYFSDRRARDSIVEGYYEAKDRYNRYRNKLTEETNDLLDEIEGND